ncbi:pheromone-regulated protein prm10 [Coemansia sp. RSA 720]|nr:pheromone-regulated protein prm10 [Coemansia sp. RSA 720]
MAISDGSEKWQATSETETDNTNQPDRLSQGGALGRDLSQLASGINNEHVANTNSRTQRPLQIHLDVATVEHDIESESSQHGYNDGLLSRYLQLAEIEQQRSHQISQAHCNHTECQQSKQIKHEFVTAMNGAVAAPQHARRRHGPSCIQSQSPDHGDSLLSCFPDSRAPQAQQSHSAHARNGRINTRIPRTDTDLTRFLPYALSTPGIQSVLGSPLQSYENSIDNVADWLNHKGHMMGAATTDHELSTPDALAERRAHILGGIQRLLQHQRFIFLVAQAMMQFGAPLHHLEDNLTRISRQLRIAATFTTMPGLVLISIEDAATFTTETKIIRCPNGYDMHRLDLTDRVVRMVGKEGMSVEEGTRQLDDILGMGPLFAWYWQLLDWGLASWSVCLLAFHGSWIDSVAAFVLGLVAGSLNLVASRLKGYTNLFEASVSILCGFVVSALGKWLCFPAVTLSATVVLLPGLVLTTGAIELAARNMHAGTIRVGYALMLAFIIAFGIHLGNNAYVEIFSAPNRASNMDLAVCAPVSMWWWWLAFPVSILSICLLINVHPRDWPVCVVAAGAMFAVFWTLVIHLQLETIGPVVSAFVLGLIGNVWGRLLRRNAYSIMLPGIMLLVPGSVGVRGIMSMFGGSETGSGAQLVSQMAQTSLSIMIGLFASSFVVHPHGKKLSALITV